MRGWLLTVLALMGMACSGGVEGDPFPDPPPEAPGTPESEEPPASAPSPAPAATPVVPAPPAAPPGPPPQPRVVLIHTSHGTAFDNWLRSTDRYAFELGPELELFTKYRDRMLVLDGFDGTEPANFGLGAYDWGPSFVFTAETFVVPLQYADWHRSNRPARPTLDYELSTATRFRGFALAFSPPQNVEPSTAGFGTFFVAAAGRDQPVRPYSDPAVVHQLLTANITTTDTSVAATLSSLADWMATADLGREEVLARTQAKLIAAALASDQTRGVVYQATILSERFGASSLHELSHWTYAGGRPEHDAARMTIARRVAAVVDELAATPFYEGGTLLDHTVVVWVDDTGFGSRPDGHSEERLPILWIGDLGGRIASGQYLRAEPGRPYVDALRTLADALGLDATALGEPFTSAAPVAEVLP